MPRKAKVLAAAALLPLSASCSFGGTPVVSDRERAHGAEQHPQLLAEFGGDYRGRQATYLARVGSRIAAAAGLEGQCTFTLINTDVVNAFAVPGCYIYVTRGLMSLVNSEDELASVLGHEVGHIAGEHAEEQQRRARLRSFGVAAVAALTGSERLTRIAGSAAAFFTLRYSRKHEYEADELGLRYLEQAGYDPFAATDMLTALDRYQALLDGGSGVDEAKSIPEWALTHPYARNRIVRVADAAQDTGLKPRAEQELRYLRQLDNLLYGDDPEQGFVLGRSFAHPLMRIAFVAPPGFTLTNSPKAIYVDGPDGLRGEFSGGPLPPGGLPRYAQAIFEGLVGDAAVQGARAQDLVVNRLPAHVLQASVATQSGEMIISLAVYAANPGSAYHFIMVSKPEPQNQLAIAELFRSFHTLEAVEVASLRPRMIDVVAVVKGDDLRSLAARMATDRPLDQFLVLNGRRRDAALRPGELIKLVVWR
jgi:predicted Zn-dependent protease